MEGAKKTKLYRALEVLPALLSWSILLFPFLATPWFPRAVSIFLIIYIFFWGFRSAKTALFLLHSFLKNRTYETIDWDHLLTFFTDNPPIALNKMEQETIDQIQKLHLANAYKNEADIWHMVIIATYKEEKEILDETIASVLNSTFPSEKIMLVLATEERDHIRAEENVKFLEKKYAKKFGRFYHFMHPDNVVGEVAAKGANISYAGRKVSEVLKKEEWDFSNIIVTTLDADNRPHNKYFSNLTYHYLMRADRLSCSFQPLPFFFNNIWEVPLTNRIIGLANTFWFLAESGEPDHLFTMASYAQSLQNLVEVDFWSLTTIVEDYHQFWRSHFHFRGNYHVIPLFIPVYQDALQSRTYFTSLVGQYRQLRRWAWGVTDIAYVFTNMLKLRKEMPLWKTIPRFTYLVYLQITWATGAILILLNRSIPTLLNPEFARSVFAYNLSTVFNILFTCVTLLVIISLWVSFVALPRREGKRTFGQILGLILQFILVPIVTIFYGSIPALEAQTRLLLNKPLAFVVTEKIRKIN